MVQYGDYCVHGKRRNIYLSGVLASVHYGVTPCLLLLHVTSRYTLYPNVCPLQHVEEEWEDYCPRVIPTATLIGLFSTLWYEQLHCAAVYDYLL